MTTLEGFVILGPDRPYGASDPLCNSHAVYIKDCGSNLTLKNNTIFAGDGGDGSHGENGIDVADGVNGSNGEDAYNTQYNCYEACVGTDAENIGGLGGSRYLDYNISGGNGGTAPCPDFDTSINSCNSKCGGICSEFTVPFRNWYIISTSWFNNHCNNF